MNTSSEMVSHHALFQEGLKEWAHQIQSGVCLIDGKKLPKELELNAGQVFESNIALTLLFILGIVDKYTLK